MKRDWTAPVVLLAVILTIFGGYELTLKIMRDEEAGRELRVAAEDVRGAALWEQSHGAFGQVSALVAEECDHYSQKIDRYSKIWGVDEGDLNALASCPRALRGAMRFYVDRVGGEYGCRVARKAFSVYVGGDVLELGHAIEECR